MCRSAKLAMWFALFLIVALAACAPAATPVSPTATNPPSPTIAPPLPTSTPRPAYHLLPMPKPSIEEMFDVGGHKMNLECYGEGSPTIVLEQDWGVGLSDQVWRSVIPNLAVETRVCVYDRLNAGASDSIGAHTFEQASNEWHALMQTAKLEPPYIVAGHSFGGPFALTHASRYPTEVVGIALIDSNSFDFCTKTEIILPAPASDDMQMLKDLRDGCHQQMFIAGRGMNLAEGIDLANEGQQQIRAIKSLGNVPLIVLVEAPSSKNFGLSWPGVPPEVAAKLDQVWLDAQKEYAALSSDSQLIIADHSTGLIQSDEPELVVKAIFSLLDKARQK
jgi:pimeloyl-ACP methyl ester carboxylesterase